MACPGGCSRWWRSAKSQASPVYLQKRMEAIYDIDKSSKIRKSHENPAILKLYEEYLGKPLGHLSHELLHTHYKDNSKSVIQRKKELEEMAKG